MLQEVRVEDAVGMVLAHDLTQILPGTFKGSLFRKGHVIREEDIPALLRIGKEHIYILRLAEGWLHEDDAARRLAAAAAGANIALTEPHEGKVSLNAALSGLVKVDRTFVDGANAVEQVVVSTLRTDTAVKAGQTVAACRVIPLVTEEERVARVEAAALERSGAQGGPVWVKPFKPLRAGLVTTGSEVFKGLIEDKFGPVVRAKLADLGSEVVEQRLVPDDSDGIVQEIHRFREMGVDLILVTGGMSVDPDDRTPGAIRRSGANIVSYGTPMLPGSMLMMAYLDGVPVMGLPGCVMHDPYTSFDVLLPRICAGEIITRQEIVAMGYGGLHGC
ncbi:molybdopterin-binding protein [Gorillibacterium massiliense]|uniref:molybdopterin-binding protein n=1 Tax=Gorillibacterium massiliense TaxID=1280390 RepID=UPI0009DFAD3A|nr:molybdopterin-binding protein [Gorillibacterium massiliense]